MNIYIIKERIMAKQKKQKKDKLPKQVMLNTIL